VNLFTRRQPNSGAAGARCIAEFRSSGCPERRRRPRGGLSLVLYEDQEMTFGGLPKLARRDILHCRQASTSWRRGNSSVRPRQIMYTIPYPFPKKRLNR